MYQLLSYVEYYQFIILTFITGLLWAMGLWTVGAMPDNNILPPLSRPVNLAKVGARKTKKFLKLGGLESEPDAKPAVHHLDDAGNYLKICKFSNLKQYCLTKQLMIFCSNAILSMVHLSRFLVSPHQVIHRPYTPRVCM
jgi:hypothetical protein